MGIFDSIFGSGDDESEVLSPDEFGMGNIFSSFTSDRHFSRNRLGNPFVSRKYMIQSEYDEIEQAMMQRYATRDRPFILPEGPFELDDSVFADNDNADDKIAETTIKMELFGSGDTGSLPDSIMIESKFFADRAIKPPTKMEVIVNKTWDTLETVTNGTSSISISEYLTPSHNNGPVAWAARSKVELQPMFSSNLSLYDSRLCGIPGFCEASAYDSCYNTSISDCDECSKPESIVFILFVVCLGLAILAGNSMILAVGWKRQKSGKASKMDACRCSLAIADLLTGKHALQHFKSLLCEASEGAFNMSDD